MTYLVSSWMFPLFVSWLDLDQPGSALPPCACRGPCILSKTSFHSLTPAQIFVQYKIAWHPAPVSRWRNDFMYTGQPCDFVVICICFYVEKPFRFFVVLLPLWKNKTKATPNPQNQYHSLDPKAAIKAHIPANYFTYCFFSCFSVSNISSFLQHTRQFVLQQPAGIELVSIKAHQPFLFHATSGLFQLIFNNRALKLAKWKPV